MFAVEIFTYGSTVLIIFERVLSIYESKSK